MWSSLAVTAALACVPVRWFSTEPASLDLLKGTVVDCIAVDRGASNDALVKEAQQRAIKVVTIGEDIQPATRDKIQGANGVVATAEALWPGILIDDEAIAGPTAAPWIGTNLGYLRYLRTQTTEPIWLLNQPPKGSAISGRRYQQVLADAALGGAHWMISLDPEFSSRLLAADPQARKDWSALMEELKFIRSLPDVRHLETYSWLGVNIAPQTGALVSGGVLDMIGAQHIPFRITASGTGMDSFFDFADNSIVKFPKPSLGRVAIRKEDVAELEHVYRRVQVTVGRTNYGLRVFNGSGVLSAPYKLPDGRVLILLANYTDYPIEDITLHVRGKWAKAMLRTPGTADIQLSIYPVEGATAVEIKALPVLGAVFVE